MKNTVTPVTLFVLSLIVFTFRSDVVGLEFKADESFYFQSAREMVDSGNWLTPYYFEKARFEKPILYYWLVALFFKLFGISWKIARLPSAISMALVIVLTYLFGKEFYNDKIGLLSSFVVVSSIGIFRYARLVLPEAFFLFLLCASLYFLIKKAYLWAYLLIGLALLTKGPVGFVLPVFILAAYSYSLGHKNLFKEARIIKGLFIALLISLPWFLYMIKVHGQPYIEHIFFRETIQRIGNFRLNTHLPAKAVLNYLKGLFYFVPIIFIFYLPWSLLIVPSLKGVSLRITNNQSKRYGAILCFVWFFAILVFFTFLGEKHRHYMIYTAVPFGIITANYFYGFSTSKGRIKRLMLLVFLFLFFITFELSKFTISREIGGIGAMFANRSFDINRADTVAIGSHSMVPQDLEVYVNHTVEKYGYKLHTQKKTDLRNTRWLNNRLFGKDRNSYLLIKETDFMKYIKPETKNELTILAEGYMYNKDMKMPDVLPNAFKAIRHFNKETFLDIFRDKVYFVTNKSSEAQTYGTR